MKDIGFASLEWFYGSPEPKPAPKQDFSDKLKEMEENAKQGKLSNGLGFKTGDIQIPGNISAMFYRNGRAIDNPADAIARDFIVYEAMLKAHRNALQQFDKDQEAFNKAMGKLANSQTTWEQLRQTILKFKEASKRHSGRNSIASKFKEPKEELLGAYSTPFLNGAGTKFITRQELPMKAPIMVRPLTFEQSDKFLDLTNSMGKVLSQLEDISEDITLCFDMTDSPMRGFMDEIDGDLEVRELIEPFIEYGMADEDGNSGLYNILEARIGNLQTAALTYLRESTQA